MGAILKMMSFDISPGVKGLIFDLDGTLADSMPWHYLAWQKACRRYGIQMDPALLRSETGSPGWMIAEKVIKNNGLTNSVSPEEILHLKYEEFTALQHNIKPITPVTALVHKYYGKLPMAVGTGGQRMAVTDTLKIIGLGDIFEIVITANDVNKHKPDPETFLKCAGMMEVDPRECEVFEDGDLGIEAARRAGMLATDVRSWYRSDWDLQ